MTEPPAEFTVTRHGPVETAVLVDEIVDVYRTANHDLVYTPFFTVDEFIDRLHNLYLPSRDFELVAGRVSEALVGFAFGSPRDDTGQIWERVATACPDIPIPPTAVPVYILREIAVSPDHQRQGRGRALHDELLQPRHEPLAHLIVRPDNQPAKTAYRQWGWRYLGPRQPLPTAPVFDAMIHTLPLPR